MACNTASSDTPKSASGSSVSLLLADFIGQATIQTAQSSLLPLDHSETITHTDTVDPRVDLHGSNASAVELYVAAPFEIFGIGTNEEV